MSIIQPVAEQTPAGAVVSAPAPAVEAGGAVAPLAARAPRPMLARDADSMYWMCRYVERAEHVARLMAVNDGVLTDLGDLAASLERRQWRAVLRILRMPEPAEPGDAAESNGDSALPFSRRVTRHMIFEADNPNGLLCCLTRARDNARGIRENISSEMWESLNALYWFIAAEDAPGRFAESSGDFYRQVMTGSMLFQGLADQTLPHDQPWRFTQLAKHLERADVTCRVIDHGFQSLEAAAAAAGPLETPLRNIHWTAVLRSCCSIEAHRRRHVGELDPHRVIGFILLEADYPRSVRYCAAAALEAIAGIRAETRPPGTDAAERILGRLEARLAYAVIPEVIAGGLSSFLGSVQDDLASAALAVQKAYFLQ